MQKTISSSCYDTIVIKQQNRTYRSTPFQVVFSSNLIKQIQKNRLKQKAQPYKLSFYVNDREVDVPVKIDQSGRVVFQKIYNRKVSAMISDSSDVSDEDHSHKSSNYTLDTKKSKSKGLQDKLQQFKNQQAPAKFWQFAWLFNQKKDETPQNLLQNIEEDESNQTNLTKIKQQAYEGQQHSKQPLFHLSLCGNLLKKKQTKQQILKTFYDHRVEYNQFIKDPPGYLNDSNLVVKIDDSIYTWQLGIAIITCRFAYGRDLTKQEIEDIIKNKFTKSRLFSFISGGSNITKLDITQFEAESDLLKAKQLKKIKQSEKPVIKYRKTPDSDIVKKMKLKYGKNIGKFELDVGEGVKQVVTMKIFLWDHSQKIVISDIDGTITRSDILGQILNKWIHTGVTKLFTQIYKRHYKIIYLTARAIGQYQQTSRFLETVEQENVYLPEGPLMMSPDGYMRSFTRQIIYKTPDYLKTKILASLNEVFPNSKNPIYCGFGNRQTDSAAYLKINIAPDKIFCITDKSIISRQSDKQFNSTYMDILANINDFFPQYFKDNEMIDSSDQNVQNVEEYHAVGKQQTAAKKTKSVDGQSGQRNMEGYELDQFEKISTNLTKTRKSQHEIPHQDIKALEQFVKETKQEEEMKAKIYEMELTENAQQNIQLKISDPATEIAKALTQIVTSQFPNSPTQQKSIHSDQKQQNSQQLRVQKQKIDQLVKEQLSRDNEVPENQVIPTNEQEKMSARSKSQNSQTSEEKQLSKSKESPEKTDKKSQQNDADK